MAGHKAGAAQSIKSLARIVRRYSIAAMATLGILAFGTAYSLNNWSIGQVDCSSPSSMSEETKARQILTRRDTQDLSAVFLADPFVQAAEGRNYLFFEVMRLNIPRGQMQGDIGLAVEDDKGIFRYKGIVLDERYHLSYPYVFMSEGEYYMTPQSNTGSVRLYRAEEFPYRWTLEKIILEGKEYGDPSVLRHDGKWWLFVSTMKNRDLEVFYSDRLDGEWTAHPKNPVVSDDRNLSRPGGRVMDYGGILLRYIQDDWPLYGNAVRIAEITTLTTSEYAESVAEKPLIKAGSTGWNELGMHTIDYIGDGRCLVDGR